MILVLLATEVEFMFPLTRGDGKSGDLVRYIVWKRRFHYGFNGFISWEIPGEIVSKFRFQWGKYVKSTSSNSADVFFHIWMNLMMTSPRVVIEMMVWIRGSIPEWPYDNSLYSQLLQFSKIH